MKGQSGPALICVTGFDSMGPQTKQRQLCLFSDVSIWIYGRLFAIDTRHNDVLGLREGVFDVVIKVIMICGVNRQF